MAIEPKTISRRRTIKLIAGIGSLPLTGLLAGEESKAAAEKAYLWRGVAMGAEASIEIHHPDRREAALLADRARQEIARLERIFSLYRSDSALSLLNQDGRLEAPPLELLTLLSRATLWHEQTDGAFNITLQPLWRLYALHFSNPNADPSGPSQNDILAARALANMDAIKATPAEVRFARPGMAVTLNGIAQGFVTDRVAELLQDAGLDHVLINLGEIRALGNHPENRPWRVGLKPFRDQPAGTQEIADLAVATSEMAGTTFDPQGRFGHILNAQAKPAALNGKGVVTAASVVAKRAVDADALSTALVAAETELDPAAFAGYLGIRRIVIGDAEGEVSVIG
jgi:thiamine biosynthesis lipoprotein